MKNIKTFEEHASNNLDKRSIFCDFVINLFKTKYQHLYKNDNTNTKEMQVCYMAYSDIEIGDDVLCPMKINHSGITFDFELPLEKLSK